MVGMLHISDLHLGWQPRFLGALAAEREKERDDVLRKAVDVALNPTHGIDVVVIAGDLFDNHRPGAALVEMTIRELNRLVAGGKALVTVPGNHDEITYHDSVYRLYEDRWPGVLVREANPSYITALSVKGVTLHLVSMAYTAGLTRCDRPLYNLPRVEAAGIHMGVFHGSLDWPAGGRNLPLCSNELAKARYHYTALGHFHRASAHRVGEGLVSYCGAPETRGLDDPGTGELQCVHLSAEGQVVSLKQVVLPIRVHRVLELTVDEVESTDDLDRAIASIAHRDHVVRLLLKGTPSVQIDEEVLRGRHGHLFYHLEVVDETVTMAVGYLEELSREISIRGLFVRNTLKAVEDAATTEEKDRYLRALRKGLRAFRGVR